MVDLTHVAIQLAWGAGAGACPSILSGSGAKRINDYVDRIGAKLQDPKHGWTSEAGDRLRAALPIAGAQIGASAAARGDGLVLAEDVEAGIAFLEASGTRLCDDG